MAIDMGTTSHYIFNSTRVTISSNPLPTISITPSNILLDAGQYEIYTITINAGAGDGPFTVNFYNKTSGQLMQNFTLYTNIDSSNTIARFKFKTGATGTFKYNATAYDTITGYKFSSSTNTIQVNQDPILTITPSNVVLDNGQTETYTLAVTNGFGSFNTELYNITGSKQQGANITIPASGSKTITFQSGATGKFTFNGISTDTGTTYPYIFNSTKNSILVNSNLKAPTLSINDSIFDMGQTVVLTSSVPTTGTSPYSYNFIVANSITPDILYS